MTYDDKLPKSTTLLFVILFVSTYAIRSITDGIYGTDASNIWMTLKYITMIAAIVLFVIAYNGVISTEMIFFKETKNIIITIILLVILSFFYMIINLNLNTYFVTQVIKMLSAIIFAFVILNCLSMQDIYTCMKFVTAFAIIGYVIEIGLDTFNVANFARISYDTSYSPFESHSAAGVSVACCAFFSYFRKEKKWLLISFVFVLLTFKRASVLFAIILLFLPWITNIDKEVSKKVWRAIPIAFIFMTVIYYWLMLDRNSSIFMDIFGKTPYEFTMGRSSRLNSLVNGNYVASGLSSTNALLNGHTLEMDFIQIFLENGILGLIVLIEGYWSVTGKNMYCTIYMIFQFVNMLTSHSLTSNFSWVLIFLVIGCVLYKNDEFSEFIGRRPKFLNNVRLFGK